MPETDGSLLRRVCDRIDAASWDEFVALYEPLLFAYIRRRGLREEDARDVDQDTFVRLVKTLPTFRLDRDRGRFRTWLWQVTVSALGDWSARNHHREEAERQRQRLRPPCEESRDDGWDTLYRRRVLAFVLNNVRANTAPRTWACFEEHLRRGRPSAEVGVELELSEGAVRVNASRVLETVREQCLRYLEELGDDDDPALKEAEDGRSGSGLPR